MAKLKSHKRHFFVSYELKALNNFVQKLSEHAKEKVRFSFCFIINNLAVVYNVGTSMYRGNSELISVFD